MVISFDIIQVDMVIWCYITYCEYKGILLLYTHILCTCIYVVIVYLI